MRCVFVFLLVVGGCTLSGRQPCALDQECGDRICADGFCASRTQTGNDAGTVVVVDAGDLDAGDLDAGDLDAGLTDAGRADAGAAQDAGHVRFDAGVDGGTDAGPSLFFGRFRKRFPINVPGEPIATATLPVPVHIPWSDDFTASDILGERFRIFDDSGATLDFDRESITVGEQLTLFLRLERSATDRTCFFAFDPVGPLDDVNAPTDALEGYDVVWHLDGAPYIDRKSGVVAGSAGVPEVGFGPVGKASHFDFTLNALTVNSNVVGGVEVDQGSFSASVWFQVDDVDDFNAVFANGGLDDTVPGYGLEYDSFSLSMTSQITDDQGDRVLSGAPFTGKDNDWHHAVMVIDRDLQQLRLYFDGVLVDVSTFSALGSLVNTAPLFIGAGRSPAQQPFIGSIDELWFAHRPIGDAEARWLSRGASGITIGPVESAD